MIKVLNLYSEYNSHKIYLQKGYPAIWLNKKNKKVHVIVWEKVNGKKPKNHDIHHIDFDKKNYLLDNLEIMTKSDHLKIHKGWVRNKNKEWIMKPCKDCKKKLLLNNFYQRKGLTPSNRCIKCTGIYLKRKLKEDDDYREKKKLYLKEYYQKTKWKK